MAMILNPQIQAKARAEIDSVVGTDRLPTINDRTRLPYVRSIMAEVFRWSPAIPLCEYMPKSLTVVTPNLLRISHHAMDHRHSTCRDSGRCVRRSLHPKRRINHAQRLVSSAMLIPSPC